MFLHLLNNKEKDLFMNLAIKAAEANGVVELAEKNLLKAYAIEMGIKPLYKTEKTLQDIIDNIDTTVDQKSRRIMLFEILGIMISDNVFDEEEKAFVNKLASAFDISSDNVKTMLELLHSYADIYNKIANCVISSQEYISEPH